MEERGSAESFSFVLWCPRKEQIKSTHTMWYSTLEKAIQTNQAKRSFLIKSKRPPIHFQNRKLAAVFFGRGGRGGIISPEKIYLPVKREGKSIHPPIDGAHERRDDHEMQQDPRPCGDERA